MKENCADCERLWQEYEDAINSRLSLVRKIQRAIEQEDAATLTSLEPLLATAWARRQSAQQAFKEHEATHTGESPDAPK